MDETDPESDSAISLPCPSCGKEITAPTPSATAKALRFRCQDCLVTVYVNRESPALNAVPKEA